MKMNEDLSILFLVLQNLPFSCGMGMTSYMFSHCQRNLSLRNFTTVPLTPQQQCHIVNLAKEHLTTKTPRSILHSFIDEITAAKSTSHFIIYVDLESQSNQDKMHISGDIVKHNSLLEINFHLSLQTLIYDIDWFVMFVDDLIKTSKHVLYIVLDVGYFITALIINHFPSKRLHQPGLLWIGRHPNLKTNAVPFHYISVLKNEQNSLGQLLENYYFVLRHHDNKYLEEILHMQIHTNQTHPGSIVSSKTNQDFFITVGKKELPTLKIITIMSGDFFMYRRHDFFNNATQNCDEPEAHLCKQPLLTGNGTVKGWELTCCTGFLIDLLKEVKKYAKFEAELELSSDNIYGGYDETTNTFNGLIGAVNSSRYDLSVAMVTVTKQRSHFVDFSHPYIDVEIAMLMDLTAFESVSSYFQVNFIANLDDYVFLSFCCLYCVSFLILGFTEYFIAKEKKQSCLILRGRRIRLRRNIFLETLSYLNRLAFGHDSGGKEPITYAGSVISVTLAAAYITIISLYTASLTVDQVHVKDHLNDISLNDDIFINPTPDFKFASMKDSSSESFFKDSEQPKFRKMYEFMKDYALTSSKNGLEKLRNGELQAVIEESLFYKQSSIICDLDTHNLKVGSSGWSFVLQKDSPWTRRISESILRLIEKDRIAELRKKWITFKCTSNIKGEKYSFHFFAMPFLGLAVIFVCCFIVTWLQRLYYHSNLSRKKTFQPEHSNEEEMENVSAQAKTLNVPSNWHMVQRMQSPSPAKRRRASTPSPAERRRAFNTQNTNTRKKSRTVMLESSC